MTSKIFEKLNLKDCTTIVVLGAPESFEPELEALNGIAITRTHTGRDNIEFLLAFVTRQAEVDKLAAVVGKRAKGDAVVWFAYPKGTSKNYTSEINRDRGWQPLGDAGFEPVSVVAIDEDWSALRLRRVEFIKTLTRNPQRRLTSAR